MRYARRRSYCSTEQELQQYGYSLKSRQCPHCGQEGFLVCHGFLRGFSATGQGVVIRGRRFLCSNRFQRSGCGRTFSVLLSEFIRAFTVTTDILWQLLTGVEKGKSIAAAWAVCAPEFAAESGHRLWKRLHGCQYRLRTALNTERPPPDCPTAVPMLQLAAHFTTVFPQSPCPFSQFQSTFQESILQ